MASFAVSSRAMMTKQPCSSRSRASHNTCSFCAEGYRSSYRIMIHQSLYSKYCSSQNYYYTKDLNDLLCGKKTPFSIAIKEQTAFGNLNRTQYLTKLFRKPEILIRITNLTEFYKFHIEIPRFFMLPLALIYIQGVYHKRSSEYCRLLRQYTAKSQSGKVKRISNQPHITRQQSAAQNVIMEKIIAHISQTDEVAGEISKKSIQKTLLDLKANLENIPFVPQDLDTELFVSEEKKPFDHLEGFLTYLLGQFVKKSQAVPQKVEVNLEKGLKVQKKNITQTNSSLGPSKNRTNSVTSLFSLSYTNREILTKPLLTSRISLSKQSVSSRQKIFHTKSSSCLLIRVDPKRQGDIHPKPQVSRTSFPVSSESLLHRVRPVPKKINQANSGKKTTKRVVPLSGSGLHNSDIFLGRVRHSRNNSQSSLCSRILSPQAALPTSRR